MPKWRGDEEELRRSKPYVPPDTQPEPPPHPGPTAQGKPNGEWRGDPGGMTAETLMELHLEEPEMIVPDILPRGLAILAGAPKIGKSWWALQLSDAVSRGTKFLGHYDVPPGIVLHLALEDNWIRLRQRMAAVLQGDDPSPNLHLRVEWPAFDQGGLDTLREWITAHSEGLRLVVVDTWQKVRAHPARDASAYEADYAAISAIKTITDPLPITLLMLHHRRKMAASDPLETILGSTAIPGAVDTNLVLDRQRSQADAILHCHGRDILDTEVALSHDKATGTWSYMGPAKEYRDSEAKKRIIATLRDNSPTAMTPAAIAKAIGKTNSDSVRYLLRKLKDEGIVRPTEKGYILFN